MAEMGTSLGDLPAAGAALSLVNGFAINLGDFDENVARLESAWNQSRTQRWCL